MAAPAGTAFRDACLGSKIVGKLFFSALGMAFGVPGALLGSAWAPGSEKELSGFDYGSDVGISFIVSHASFFVAFCVVRFETRKRKMKTKKKKRKRKTKTKTE